MKNNQDKIEKDIQLIGFYIDFHNYSKGTEDWSKLYKFYCKEKKYPKSENALFLTLHMADVQMLKEIFNHGFSYKKNINLFFKYMESTINLESLIIIKQKVLPLCNLEQLNKFKILAEKNINPETVFTQMPLQNFIKIIKEQINLQQASILKLGVGKLVKVKIMKL